LLAPHETAYVEFLRLRRVPLTEAGADTAALSGLPDLCADVRALAEADRDVMEKGTRAFVSWVRTVSPATFLL
jgi:ATP-dependent RNA helicase DDX55/SPB4